MEPDNVSVSESVETVNMDLPEDHGIDYRYTDSSGLHTLTVRGLPELTIKTKDTNRALNFVSFFNAGVYAGYAAEKARRDEESEAASVAPDSDRNQPLMRRTWNRLLGRV